MQQSQKLIVYVNCYNQSPFPWLKQPYETAFASIKLCNKSSCGEMHFK